MSGVVVSPTGSRSIQPIVDTVYRLQAVFRNGRRDLGFAVIKVKLPEEVTISANYMVPLLVQALKGTPVKRVVVANSVELDLTGYEDIAIGAGVTLEGGRTVSEPCARLFTRTRPKHLSAIDGDNVHITGVRIEGPDQGTPTEDEPNHGVGIIDYFHINLEIDHNEI